VALEEYFKIRRLTGLSFSFDEKLVAYLSDEGGRPNVWVRPIAGGPATQVTHVDGVVHTFAFSPAADLLELEVDHGGDELPRLYLTTSRGGTPRDVAPDLPPGRRTAFVGWSDDGKTLLYLSSARDERALDLHELDVKTGKSQLLWESDGTVAFRLASRDHRSFIVAERHSDQDSDLYLIDRSAPKRRTLLTPHTPPARYAPAYFSRDGKTLYFTSDETGEFTSLFSMNLATRQKTAEVQTSWDVDGAAESFTGRYAFVVVNADGAPRVTVTDRRTKKAVALPSAPAGGAWDIFDFTRSDDFFLGTSRTDRYLGVRLQGDTAPSTPYVVDLVQGTQIPVADTLPESLRGHPMVSGKSIRIRSFDGRDVPAFLYAPAGRGPFPAVIDVHGGPTVQASRKFDRMRQYLVSKGYVVLVPNVRGSTGYGKTWTRLDNKDLGGGPLKDIAACKRYLVDEANVDADKVVVMGAIYGGYMALAAEAFTPTEFAANVDYFGVSDWKRAMENIPPYWAANVRYLYEKFGDPRDPADASYLHDRSPINFVGQMVRPLLVVQGDRDPKVTPDQSERIVAALKERHVPVHYLLLTGEGHTFSKGESLLRASLETDRFLDRYVLGDTRVQVE
jgi:dipeptidyl aminopeptidase/acylaminoacyl peptidase